METTIAVEQEVTAVPALAKAPSVPETKAEIVPAAQAYAALTQSGRVSFALPRGTYVVSCSTSDHHQSVTVSGIALYSRLQPLSARETVSAVVEHLGGDLSVTVTTSVDKGSTDGLLCVATPVQFQ